MQAPLVAPRLRGERERAKAALDGLALWSEWKAAHTWALWAVDACVRDGDGCVCTDPVLLADQLLDVEGDLEALDELSAVLQARAAMRRVEELERQVVATEQWRGFQEAQRRLQEVQSHELLDWTRAMEQRLAAARVRPRTGPTHKQSQPPARSLPASSSSPVQPVQPAHPASMLTSTPATPAGSACPLDRVSGIASPAAAAASSSSLPPQHDDKYIPVPSLPLRADEPSPKRLRTAPPAAPAPSVGAAEAAAAAAPLIDRSVEGCAQITRQVADVVDRVGQIDSQLREQQLQQKTAGSTASSCSSSSPPSSPSSASSSLSSSSWSCWSPQQSVSSAASDEDELCTMCSINPISIRLLPCRCASFCNSCSTKHITEEQQAEISRIRNRSHLDTEPLVVACPFCTKPVLSCDSSFLTPSRPSHMRRAAYKQTVDRQLAHLRVQVKPEVINDDTAWLDTVTIAFACTFFNSLEGPDSGVLFLSTLYELPTGDAIISGRKVDACHTLIRVVHVRPAHWAAALWSRAHPSVVYTFDSKPGDLSQHRHVLHLLNTFARAGARVEAVEVAQQDDDRSCGWFVLAFLLCLLSAPRQPDACLLTDEVRQQLMVAETGTVKQLVRGVYAGKQARVLHAEVEDGPLAVLTRAEETVRATR